jgi:peptidoglycan/LPS O-acetylase OafA/YrhL
VKPPRVSRARILQAACVLALVALAMIAWSLFDPRPIPVILAMSVGQGLGTASFAAFLWVVVVEVRRAMREVPPESRR